MCYFLCGKYLSMCHIKSSAGKKEAAKCARELYTDIWIVLNVLCWKLQVYTVFLGPLIILLKCYLHFLLIRFN